MNDLMHEWLVAEIKKSFGMERSGRESRLLEAVSMEYALLERQKPKHAAIIKSLFLGDEWHSITETASGLSVSVATVNNVKRRFLNAIKTYIEGERQ